MEAGACFLLFGAASAFCLSTWWGGARTDLDTLSQQKTCRVPRVPRTPEKPRRPSELGRAAFEEKGARLVSSNLISLLCLWEKHLAQEI